MAKITITEAVHVSIAIDGEHIDRDLTVGDIEVEQAIADLLIAQGLATEVSRGGKKIAASAPVETPTIETPSEA